MAAEISKPDFSFQWASGGAIVAPSDVKIQTGWTAEVPPFQWENFAQNRQDNAILHLFQKGISEWDAASNYYFTTSGTRSYVQGSDGAIYVALQDSVGQNPTTATAYWQKAFIDQTTLQSALNAAAPIVGNAQNAYMRVGTAAATATFTCNEVIVAATLTGNRYKLSSFSKPINLATTGVGGMDTGVAPVTGYVALYAIYNPTTSTSALLATNAPASPLSEIYAGANMPSGYTASALVCVWPTTASSLFSVGTLRGRRVSRVPVTVLSTSVGTGVPTTLSIGSAVPFSAVSCRGNITITSAAGSNNNAFIYSDALLVAQQYTSQGPGTGVSGNWEIDLTTAQTLFYQMNVTAAPGAFTIQISSYEF